MAKKKKSITREPAPVTNVAEARAWAAARGVTEIECLVPDLAGVARGKIMPSAKFFDDTAMALPSSIFMQTISGEYPEKQGGVPLYFSPRALWVCRRVFPPR